MAVAGDARGFKDLLASVEFERFGSLDLSGCAQSETGTGKHGGKAIQ
jgi:hypothetical protein